LTSDRSLPISFAEFVALMAMLISLVAVSIDAMLPALPAIGRDLGVHRANDNQLVISLLFLGMSAGQLIYGPLSDRIGRKPAIYIGLTLFALGCLLSIAAASFPLMLAGRTLQGLGVAAPRIVTMALVRDQVGGRAMARVMSFVMSVFILVPVVAPLMGQMIVNAAGWRAIFGAYLVHALVAATWFGLRQPETLPPPLRRPISPARLLAALREIAANRRAGGYTLVTGLIAGAFFGYLNSAQQIFQEQYRLGQRFPYYFALLAIAFGAATLFNGWMVVRFGMRRLVRAALRSQVALALVFGAAALLRSGHPPLWSLMGYLLATFFAVGILFGNLNAMAMQPLGHIAGTGASVVGSLSTFSAMILGALIGQAYNGTVIPLAAGFLLLGAAAAGVMGWVERGAGAV
jgi:DHA1 family bicyclomycin/chloramphenicol resistance-like MFS transporter